MMITFSFLVASLCMFLNAVGINTDIDKGIFGKVMHFINVTMVRQNYIILQTGELLKGASYKWGSRAESTISKHKILEFVSKVCISILCRVICITLILL